MSLNGFAPSPLGGGLGWGLSSMCAAQEQAPLAPTPPLPRKGREEYP